MSQVRLILALHDHQPVGNFDGVFEEAYRTAYLPFLEVLEGYPEIPFVLHTSGPLMEWLVEHRPEFIARLRRLVESGRVEILGGGFHEPILTMIPHRDRVGQIRDYSRYLEETLGARVRGMWIAERVWEQSLVSSIAEAGIEYTILDDAHFLRAGCAAGDVLGYYLTEDEGRLLKVFPGSEALRYNIPFREPHESYEYLRRLADRRPGATVVFADDGEKFGSWPETFEHVYKKGWLHRFCDMLLGNRDWLETTTLARAVDATLPEGKVYLPDGSYREMTEWALEPDAPAAYRRASTRVEAIDDSGEASRFFRPGGFWRNFKVKYAECDEMYSRMLAVSRRLAALEAGGSADPDYLEVARQELYRGQCNCPYWHGSFGGLYLPHLRNAIYRGLIAADNAMDDAEGRSGPRVALEVADLNLDARQEVRLENEAMIALVRPACGGHLYELDVRRVATNLLATLDRRPEPYHEAIREARRRHGERRLHGDRRLRTNRVQAAGARGPAGLRPPPAQGARRPFLSAGAGSRRSGRRPRDRARRLRRRGLPVAGPARASAGRPHHGAARPRRRARHSHPQDHRASGRLARSLDRLCPGRPAAGDVCFHFAVEINVAAMAGHAPDRYFLDAAGAGWGCSTPGSTWPTPRASA